MVSLVEQLEMHCICVQTAGTQAQRLLGCRMIRYASCSGGQPVVQFALQVQPDTKHKRTMNKTCCVAHPVDRHCLATWTFWHVDS